MYERVSEARKKEKQKCAGKADRQDKYCDVGQRRRNGLVGRHAAVLPGGLAKDHVWHVTCAWDWGSTRGLL